MSANSSKKEIHLFITVINVPSSYATFCLCVVVFLGWIWIQSTFAHLSVIPIRLTVTYVNSFILKVENILIAGGGRKDNYLSEMISHVIADDGAEDEVTEAKELFRLPVVLVTTIMLFLYVVNIG